MATWGVKNASINYENLTSTHSFKPRTPRIQCQSCYKWPMKFGHLDHFPQHITSLPSHIYNSAQYFNAIPKIRLTQTSYINLTSLTNSKRHLRPLDCIFLCWVTLGVHEDGLSISSKCKCVVGQLSDDGFWLLACWKQVMLLPRKLNQ
jgi:hypothetical protein